MQIAFHNPGLDYGSSTYQEKESPQHHPRIHDRVLWYSYHTTVLTYIFHQELISYYQ